MWSEQQESPASRCFGQSDFQQPSAAALLSYDVAHAIPWDWRVSLYTWTKGLAAGIYLVAALLLLFGVLRPADHLMAMVTPGLFRRLSSPPPVVCWFGTWSTRNDSFLSLPAAVEELAGFKGASYIAALLAGTALHFLGSLMGATSLQALADIVPGILCRS